MNYTVILRVSAPLIGLGLLLGACSSSGSSGSDAASGDKTSSTTSSTGSGGDTGSGATGAGSDGASSDTDICAAVTGDQVAEILGQTVTGTEELSVEDRFRSSGTGAGCDYLGKPQAGMEFSVAKVEFVDCETGEGILTDPTVSRVELSGVGDEAKARPDAVDSTKVIDTISTSGDRCLYIRIFQGATVDQATALTKAIWQA